MASAADDSNLPSPSSLFPPCGNDGQERYRDGAPQLVVRQNRPLAAAATVKHRHYASTMRRAFIWLIKIVKTIISSSFNDMDLSLVALIVLAEYCVRRRRGRGTMAAVGRRRTSLIACRVRCLPAQNQTTTKLDPLSGKLAMHCGGRPWVQSTHVHYRGAGT